MLNLRKIAAFTLTELLIVVAIIGVISVIGGISIQSRMQVSRLEQAALGLASDASYARTAALFKGCPTRIVFCPERTSGQPLCSDSDIGNLSGVAQPVLESARYYAILRLSQYADATADCFVSGGIDPDSSVGVLNAFDFDRKPQSLPRGVILNAMYTPGSLNQATWTNFDKGGIEAGNSLWFPTSIDDLDANEGVVNLPISTAADRLNESGDLVLFQVELEDCPASDPDCPAFFVLMDDSGETSVQKCLPGVARSGNKNGCF